MNFIDYIYICLKIYSLNMKCVIFKLKIKKESNNIKKKKRLVIQIAKRYDIFIYSFEY